MRILIVKTSSLGDIIQAFPVVSYLKQVHPSAQIDWVVEKPFSELLRAHPQVNAVLTVDTKAWRKKFWIGECRQEIQAFIGQLRYTNYDVVIDLQGNIKSGLITGCAKADKKIGFGSSTVAEWPNILFTSQRINPPANRNIRQDYLFIAQNAFQDYRESLESPLLNISSEEKDRVLQIVDRKHNKDSRIIMVCPGSMWPNKKLSKETLAEFLHLLSQEKESRFIFIWGTPQEKEEAEELHKAMLENSVVSPKVSLPMLQHLMAAVDLVISMDSLPLHLAGTTATPTYSVFGASLATKYRPLGAQHHAYQGPCPYNETFAKRCPKLRTCPTGRCMKDIAGQDLLANFKNQISKQ